MNTLAAQQRALLDALFVAPHAAQAAAVTADLAGRVWQPWQRGLAAYRANGHALAERSLLAAFPVVAALVGTESFALMARDYWHSAPPVRGDLAQWGESLPTFIADNDQLADVPYLADVARVEWALHQAAGAADGVADPASFALLSTIEPDAITLRLPPGTTVLASDWPAASLVTAHLDSSPSMEDVARRVRAGEAEHALIWRQGFKPRVRACAAPEAALVRALAGGQPLLMALDAALAADADADFDFASWLAPAVQQGLVLGATAHAGQTPPN